MEKWNSTKSTDLYAIENWGDGYFSISPEGRIIATPNGTGHTIDLFELTQSIEQRGIELPVLIRFDGIIRDRVRRIQKAFDDAINESEYEGRYRGAYPIKVNQQRHVVDSIREAGRDIGLGLEVGSKPELLAVLAMHDTPDALLLCNGYKDEEYIELALLSKRVGRRPIIILEQLNELQHVLDVSARLGIEAELGIRIKPIVKGSGRWASSSGEQAKFGLSAPEIMIAIRELARSEKTHWLKLMHFHIGSQITSIGAIKKVLREATRMYTEIFTLCPHLEFFDVGGGLAVDYDGSRTNFESSANYSLEEYARDVVYAIGEACTEAEIPHPDIISESGRAMVAHHAVLVAQVTDVTPTLDVVSELGAPPSEHELLAELLVLYDELSVKNCHETLNDALSLKEQIWEQFTQGGLSLEERAFADKSFWHLIAKIKHVSKELKYVPEDLEALDSRLRDTYFANFSLFQSLPDSWAIQHLFPVMPIHRLDTEPTRRAVIADVSCDSDGKLDRFIDLKDIKNYLPLHTCSNGDKYYFGVFLVGAYQEILGDLHNLFGDTNAVHVDVDSDGKLEFTHVVDGDTVREVLKYVQYEPEDLIERLRVSIERSLANGELSPEDSVKLRRKFRESLEEYTYLKF